MNIFWFRRDLRLHDNTALNAALKKGSVQPVFIFDTNILSKLSQDDSRLTFIHSVLDSINNTLNKHNASIMCYYGNPLEVWKKNMVMIMIMMITMHMPAPLAGFTSRPALLLSAVEAKIVAIAICLIAVRDGKVNLSY